MGKASVVLGVDLNMNAVDSFDDATHCEGSEIYQADVPSLNMDS